MPNTFVCPSSIKTLTADFKKTNQGISFRACRPISNVGRDDDLLHHYDSRFFQGIVTYEERTRTLHHMVRAYLKFFHEKGLETWIAHGTLLGWWWNGAVRLLSTDTVHI